MFMRLGDRFRLKLKSRVKYGQMTEERVTAREELLLECVDEELVWVRERLSRLEHAATRYDAE
jgi:hypothetical protein